MPNKKVKKKPSTKGANGRDGKGRFAKGNPGGPGNPYGKRVHVLRQELLNTVTSQDLRKVIKKLISEAKAGESWAIKEILDRVIGKAPLYTDLELVEKIEALQNRMDSLETTGSLN